MELMVAVWVATLQSMQYLTLWRMTWPLLNKLIDQHRVGIDQTAVARTVPDQMKLTAFVVQIDTHFTVGQGGVSLGHDQLHRVHIDIDHGFTLVGILQALFGVLQTDMERAVDVKMDLTDRDGLLVGAGLAPAFDRQGTHDETSHVVC